ncbi:DUF6214 family protein [Streptomyces griseosporeus]|uniref:DUF6214 family protein n=1 Tax=Streptomyces griseosporeus TaxID=1910 RepID=UPI00378CEE33
MLEASFLNLSDRSGTDGAVSVWPAWEVKEEGGATSWFQVRLSFPDGARVDALAVVSGGCVRLEDVRAQPPLSLADLTVLADWIEEPLFEACGVPPAGGKGAAPSGEDALPGEEFTSGEGAVGGEKPWGGEEPRGGEESWGGEEPWGGDTAPLGATVSSGPSVVPWNGTGEEEEDDDGYDGYDGYDETPDEAGAGARRARPAWPRGIEGRWLIAQEYRAAQEEGVDPVLAVMCATGHSRRKSLRLIAQARDAGYLTPRHTRR